VKEPGEVVDDGVVLVDVVIDVVVVVVEIGGIVGKGALQSKTVSSLCLQL
jgi:hypothetical protein